MKMSFKSLDLRDFPESKLVSAHLSLLDTSFIIYYFHRQANLSICQENYMLYITDDTKPPTALLGSPYLDRENKIQIYEKDIPLLISRIVERKCRFLLVPFSSCCYGEDAKEGHMEILFFDFKDHTVERVNPSGFFSKKWLDLVLDQFLKDNFPDFRYFERCLMIGVQSKELYRGIKGMCHVWALLIIHLKMLNPELSGEDIQRILIKTYTPKELQVISGKYLTLLHRMVQWEHFIQRVEVDWGDLEEDQDRLDEKLSQTDPESEEYLIIQKQLKDLSRIHEDRVEKLIYEKIPRLKIKRADTLVII